MTSLQELHENFISPLNLTWHLDNHSRRRPIEAALLPGLVILAMLIRIPLVYAYSADQLLQFGLGAPELWQRLYRAATTQTCLHLQPSRFSSWQASGVGPTRKEAGCSSPVACWPLLQSLSEPW